MKTVQIDLVGDYNADVPAHRATPPALALAAGSIDGGVRVETARLPTDTLAGQDDDLLAARLSAFDGLWCVPHSPYASEPGTLSGIRFARVSHVPFLGTCGGFQHAENQPGTGFPPLAPLTCAPVEREGDILLREGSRVRQIYGQAQVREASRCSFGLNPGCESRLDDGRRLFTGREASGGVRVLELAEPPFFFATLFQPERSALKASPTTHPLICAHAAATFQRKSR